MTDDRATREFPSAFDEMLTTADGEHAYFGRDVLRGLVDGINEHVRITRANSSRWLWGTGVLGCAMWMDDPELMAALRRCPSSCVIVRKQPRKNAEEKYAPLRRLIAAGGGVSPAVFPELDELAEPEDGGPHVIGPSSRLEPNFDAVRELGFRSNGGQLVPIVHAKIALVGELRWTDEHPSGYSVDTLFFRPTKLWVGSANFTTSSRRSLEVGMWTRDAQLLDAGRRFLLELVASSEPLGGGDEMDPQYQPVVYDNAAFLEASRNWDAYDGAAGPSELDPDFD